MAASVPQSPSQCPRLPDHMGSRPSPPHPPSPHDTLPRACPVMDYLGSCRTWPPSSARCPPCPAYSIPCGRRGAAIGGRALGVPRSLAEITGTTKTQKSHRNCSQRPFRLRAALYPSLLRTQQESDTQTTRPSRPTQKPAPLLGPEPGSFSPGFLLSFCPGLHHRVRQ